MKKIKISELPLFSSLKGLHTIGTDKDNRSVKVSLEFIENETNEAVKNAETATAAANTATSNANTAEAVRANNESIRNINEDARKAAEEARVAEFNRVNNIVLTSGQDAQDAATVANEATELANTATAAANSAAASATAAASSANNAATNAAEQAETAEAAALQVENLLGRIFPTGLEVKAIQRITYGNTAQNHVEATLSPSGTLPNIIFISDNEAVKIDQKGRIKVVGIGTSEVQIIPTCNTGLAKTILIEVASPTLRLNTLKQLRLTQSGNLLLN